MKIHFLLSVLIILSFQSNLNAQTVSEIGPNFPGNHSISGTSTINATPYNFFDQSVHIQFIYTASEIMQGGANQAYNIDSIGWYVMNQIGGSLLNYTIKMKNTLSTHANVYDNNGLTTVRNPSSLLPATDTAWYMIPLTNSFMWDGTSNLLIDVCWGVNLGNTATGSIRQFNQGMIAERIFEKNNFNNMCSLPISATALSKPYVRLAGTCANTNTIITDSICSGQSYLFNGNLYSTTGVYTDTFQSSIGCDSMVSLDLKTVNSFTTILDENICSDTSYTFAGQILTQNGTYIDTLQTAGNCDSIIQLNLFFVSIDTTITKSGNNYTANQNNAQYQWYDCMFTFQYVNTQTFNPTNFGQFIVTLNYKGCLDTSECMGYYLPESVKNVGANPALSSYQIIPNPALNYIKIKGCEPNTEIKIYNMTGTLVQRNNTQNDQQVPIESLPKGIYLIQIDNSYWSKFYKE